MARSVLATSLLGLTVLAGASRAVAADALAAADLADLSLEELMNIEVYSVAKKIQRLSDSAAAVYVLTQEDIRRSGVTSIPEALRLVPGVEVARIDSNKWAISIRGFNERFANKLLVLIDGRSVYTPLFAGVYWEVQDTALEDIDRIEVIRGPGGTLWGANAVNGVINIITKNAADTQGWLLSGGAGTEEEGFGTLRYGARIGDKAYARVYGKYFARDDFEPTLPRAGDDASDEWRMTRGGFRIDYEPTDDDTLTLQGDLYEGDAGAFVTVAAPPPDFTRSGTDHADVAGGNVLGRWTHRFSGGSELRTQAYYDRTDRETNFTTREDRHTIDLDVQHHVQLGQRHDFVWGFGYRVTWDEINGTFAISFDPDSRTAHLVSGFVQDEISLFDDDLRVTLGTKLEYNDYSGFEIQPNARALWKATDRQTVWGAISRAVRTPSRAEDDIRINSAVIPPGMPGTPCETSPLPCVLAFVGDGDFDAEELYAFELGYRLHAQDNLSFDVAAFYNIYDSLRTLVPDPAMGFVEAEPAPPHFVIPIFPSNAMEAETWGVEIAGDWRPRNWWTLRAGYTFFEMDLELAAKAQSDPVSRSADGSSPQNQVFLRSLLDLPAGFELDSTFKWVDELKSLGIDDYATLDLRLGWKPADWLELAVVGQNLLEDSHREFAPSQFVNDEPTRVERGVYGKVTVRF